MPLPVGIDLGTSNSLLCILRRGVVETVPIEGRSLLPSCVGIRSGSEILVGTAAKSFARIHPTCAVSSAKRFIGDGVTQWEIGGNLYTPTEISALILKKLKSAAEEYLREPVYEAVITVPAYFGANQKLATREAGERAGLKVLQLLPEPTAAAISYGLDKGKDQTILVYDLGGGTFDVSILKVHRNSFTVVAVDGDFHLGGDDFDRLLALEICSMLPKIASTEANLLQKMIEQQMPAGQSIPLPILTAGQQILEAAERAKIDLSNPAAAHTQIMLSDVLGKPFDCEITLVQYNRLIQPLVERTIAKTRAVLKATNMDVEDVDRVVLVGGSTRNRLVLETLAREIKEPWISDRVDEAVAQGAAIVANASRLAVPLRVRNVTALNLGVRATKAGEPDHFQILIPKNTQIPASRDEIFTTERANQKSVKIAVFQGDSPICASNTFVGGFLLEGIPSGRAREPEITVRFQMDDSDLLTVTATCKHQQSSKKLDVNMVSREVEMASQPASADIIFLIDTSGSMSREIDGVKRSCVAFAEKVQSEGIECRLGLMDFDKSGSAYKWEIFGPMEPNALPRAIHKLAIGRLGGSGCYIGEAQTIPVIEAFLSAFKDPDRNKIGILISDEVGNDPSAVAKIITLLSNAGVCLFVVGVSGSCHEKIAVATQGKFWDIVASRGDVDLSHVLGAIATEITNLSLR